MKATHTPTPHTPSPFLTISMAAGLWLATHGCGSSKTDGIASIQSCASGGPGTTDCGAAGESCCASLEVPSGTYDRTYDDGGLGGPAVLATDGGPTDLADPATVSGFRLDKYLVTVGRFRQFVGAWNKGFLPSEGSGKHTHLNGGLGLVTPGPGPDGGVAYESGWDATDWNNTDDINPTNANLQSCFAPTWTSTAASQENLPIVCVTWYEAYAFCIWDGGFLPSEAEWEYAAAGGNEQLEYPWGSIAPGTACPGTGCEYAIYGCYYPSGPDGGNGGECLGGVASIAPVGTATLGAARWGQLDMDGDATEWVLDWFALAYLDPCTDCANLAAGQQQRVYRGSNFNDGAVQPPSYRGQQYPFDRANGLGFRCARTP